MERRNNVTPSPFRDTPCEKGGSRLLRRSTFEPLFMTPEVGSTSPWTLFAAMLGTALSHPMCRQTTTFLWGVLSAIQGASAWSSCLVSPLAMRYAISLHVCLSRQTALDTSSSHPCTALHDLVTLHGSGTMFMPRLNMQRRIKSTSLF